MEAFEDGQLRIDVEASENALVLAWKGKSNARDPDGALRPFFDGIANEASRSGRLVEMNLDGLDYFNSSTLAAMIRAIRRFRAQHTRVRVTYPDEGWQRRSLDALRVFIEADGAVEIGRGGA